MFMCLMGLPLNVAKSQKTCAVPGAQGQVVWEGPSADFDKSENPFVQQFASGSLAGPIRYE